MSFLNFPISIRQLQYVVAVADELNFRRAAERCFVSQPSLSAQVAEAERALGVRFFERDSRRVLVTAAGAEVVARARELIVGFGDLLEAAQEGADPLRGTLRVGVIPTIAPYLLPDLDPVLRATFPDLRLIWVEDKTEALVEQVERGALDAALVAAEAGLGSLVYEPVGEDPFVVAAPPGHALAEDDAPLRLAELAEHELLLLDDGHCFRDQALELCASAGAHELNFRATSLSTLVQMVASGDRATLLPRLAVEVENRRGRLVVRPFVQPGPKRTLALAWRRHSAIAEALATLALAASSAQSLLA